jgi:glycosyltransferase involved in cell wall biosynthesis
MRPKVSVIIITYNRSRFLCEAIRSVSAQTFRDWELLVVDDGSTDDTCGLVKSCRLDDQRIWYFCNSRNMGIVASRARALSEASGEYVAVIDSDDVWTDPDKLSKQVAFLDGHPDYVLLGGGVVVVDGHGKEVRRYLNSESDEAVRREILAKNPFAHSSVMYRADAARRVGGYRRLDEGDGSDSVEDYDLFLRLGLEGKLGNLREYLVQYRKHGGNVTSSRLLAMMRKNLALVNKYGSKYPRYYRAWLRRAVRLSAARTAFSWRPARIP